MNKDITSLAESIFGSDIVESAYVCPVNDEETQVNWPHTQYEGNYISFYGMYKIRVKFKNGKTVDITASDAGGIYPAESH